MSRDCSPGADDSGEGVIGQPAATPGWLPPNRPRALRSASARLVAMRTRSAAESRGGLVVERGVDDPSRIAEPEGPEARAEREGPADERQSTWSRWRAAVAPPTAAAADEAVSAVAVAVSSAPDQPAAPPAAAAAAAPSAAAAEPPGTWGERNTQHDPAHWELERRHARPWRREVECSEVPEPV